MHHLKLSFPRQDAALRLGLGRATAIPRWIGAGTAGTAGAAADGNLCRRAAARSDAGGTAERRLVWNPTSCPPWDLEDDAEVCTRVTYST